MDLAGRNVVVIGAGRTGQSTARFLVEQGARTRVLERDPVRLANATLPPRVQRITDDEGDEFSHGVDLVVPSPGVPRTHPLLVKSVARGIPVWSEIELAGRHLRCPLLAVTGTNGKSTTTTLLGAMLQASGAQTFVGGNLGTPLIEAVCRSAPPYDAVVAEVSSFQLEWTHLFRPDLAIVLNLTPDHLDRYSDLADYGHAKAGILTRQQPGDVAVLNRDDPWVWDLRSRTRGTVISFGREPVEFGAFIDAGELVYWGPEPQPRRFPLSRVRLHGTHNHENMMAAVTAASVRGVAAAAVQRALEEAEGLPHRLQLVREHAGVRFFDDSKGTNVGAVVKSLQSFSGNVILLVGGYDKGGDFSVLRPWLASRVKKAVLFGAARDLIASQIAGAVDQCVVTTLAEAVAAARAAAASGDTVLLSPGCASFDEFTDYAERGRRFCQLLEAI
jgi:UDP-N-acetylmuramoylalanine--D-glutamate ligase